MRRQAGADTVTLDTRKGTATFTYNTPRQIDFGSIQRAAHTAAYTIKRLELSVLGQLTSAACAACQKDVPHLKVDQTGQLLEIRGDLSGVATGTRARLLGRTGKWGRDRFGALRPRPHVVLDVVTLTAE